MLPGVDKFVATQDDVFNKDFGDDDVAEGGNAKRLVLYIRMPIRQRHTVQRPEATGERLTLYHVRTQSLCTCITDGVFFLNKARTGHLFVRNFNSAGQLADPRPYEQWLKTDTHEAGRRWF